MLSILYVCILPSLTLAAYSKFADWDFDQDGHISEVEIMYRLSIITRTSTIMEKVFSKNCEKITELRPKCSSMWSKLDIISDDILNIRDWQFIPLYSYDTEVKLHEKDFNEMESLVRFHINSNSTTTKKKATADIIRPPTNCITMHQPCTIHESQMWKYNNLKCCRYLRCRAYTYKHGDYRCEDDVSDQVVQSWETFRCFIAKRLFQNYENLDFCSLN
ncbi:uncharacterized protein LOC131928027 [Physella acuta]|uniref:uncharacterized protein LOC131928027 n=1 Tax=Physella acuta TaxID=109671 RepID=UPI0027DE2305|nr:uncharacterized protein LOC131928027 [Physella acuta]